MRTALPCIRSLLVRQRPRQPPPSCLALAVCGEAFCSIVILSDRHPEVLERRFSKPVVAKIKSTRRVCLGAFTSRQARRSKIGWQGDASAGHTEPAAKIDQITPSLNAGVGCHDSLELSQGNQSSTRH